MYNQSQVLTKTVNQSQTVSFKIKENTRLGPVFLPTEVHDISLSPRRNFVPVFSHFRLVVQGSESAIIAGLERDAYTDQYSSQSCTARFSCLAGRE